MKTKQKDLKKENKRFNLPNVNDDELLFLLNSIDNWSCFVNNLTSSVIFCNLFKFSFVPKFIFLLSLFKYSIKEQWLEDFSNISIVVVLIFVSWIWCFNWDCLVVVVTRSPCLVKRNFQ